jgi:hypothetical protein
LSGQRYTTDELKAEDNNAAFVMESQLRQPQSRPASLNEFDLLVGPIRSNFIGKMRLLGPSCSVHGRW